MESSLSNGYYVYVYRDTRPSCEGKPVYVGMGRHKRAWKHWVHGAGNPHLQNILELHRKVDKVPEIIIVQKGLSFEQAANLEVFLIGWYGRRANATGTLTNMCEGGRGAYGFRFTKEQRKAHTTAMKAYWADPKYKADLAAKISEAYPESRKKRASERAKNRPAEELAKISRASKERMANPSERANMFEKSWHNPGCKTKRSAGTKAYWAAMTKEQRTAEMRRRANCRWHGDSSDRKLDDQQ